jgi:hypothetical protein
VVTAAEAIALAARSAGQDIPGPQLMLGTTAGFVRAGAAYHWWQGLLIPAVAMRALPFEGHWGAFRADFLAKFTAHNEKLLLREELKRVKMRGEDLRGYVSAFNNVLSRLDAITEGPHDAMSVTDTILQFQDGIPQRHLALKVDIHARSLEDAVKPLEKYHATLQAYEIQHPRAARGAPGGAGGASGSGARSERAGSRGERRGGARVYALEEDDDDASGGAGQDPGYWDEPPELYAAGASGAPRGRWQGRGRGRGPPQGARGRAGSDAQRRGSGANGRGGPRGGAPVPPRPSHEQVLAWRQEGVCVGCGSADHWVHACPALAARRGASRVAALEEELAAARVFEENA